MELERLLYDVYDTYRGLSDEVITEFDNQPQPAFSIEVPEPLFANVPPLRRSNKSKQILLPTVYSPTETEAESNCESTQILLPTKYSMQKTEVNQQPKSITAPNIPSLPTLQVQPSIFSLRSMEVPVVFEQPRHISQLLRESDSKHAVERNSCPLTKGSSSFHDYLHEKPLPPVPQLSIPSDPDRVSPMTLREKMDYYYSSMLELESTVPKLEDASDAISMRQFPTLHRSSATSDTINTDELYALMRRGDLHKIRQLVKEGRAVPDHVLLKRISALDRLEGKKTTPIDDLAWPALPWMKADSEPLPSPADMSSPVRRTDFWLKAGHAVSASRTPPMTQRTDKLQIAPNRFQARPMDNPNHVASKAAAILGLAKRARERKGIPSTVGLDCSTVMWKRETTERSGTW
jgi:hypothetical protein